MQSGRGTCAFGCGSNSAVAAAQKTSHYFGDKHLCAGEPLEESVFDRAAVEEVEQVT